MTTLEKVLKTHEDVCSEARAIISKKGHDYNREQQQTGDTLFNLTVCKQLGVVDSTTQGILVRLSDKFMRLISLTKNPKTNLQVSDESIRDTVRDVINYSVYLLLKYEEERNDERLEADIDWIKRQDTHPVI